MTTRIVAADLFCGAGGTTSGLRDACNDLGRELWLLAINHWQIAIDTHSANHPDAVHLCESLDGVDPRKVVPGGKLRLLVASPECTHFSNARGGKPRSDQSRASAWHVLRWCEALQIQDVLIENVVEFRRWGPLGTNGQLLKKREGETYNAFLNALCSLGYAVEERVLCAADYGDPTSRRRLFIRARKGRKPIVWPAPTHSPYGEKTLFGELPAYRTAREIIDWSDQGESIFARKRPLAPNTIRRIMAGLQKFSGVSFMLGQQSCATARTVDQPVPTVCAAGAISLIQPFLVKLYKTSECASIDAPVPTITASGQHIGLAEPFIIPLNHGAGDLRTNSLDLPMPTITSVDAWGLIEPFLVKYYGSGVPRPITQPMDTLTAKDRFGLCIPVGDGRAIVDIRFRMLKPAELARAHSLDDYKFSGTREEIVKQIGNSVPRQLARQLCYSALAF